MSVIMNLLPDQSAQTSSIDYRIIPLDQITIHPENVRQGNAPDNVLCELVANIESIGLLHALHCVQTNDPAAPPMYGVVAGGMRYRALSQLAEANKMPQHLSEGIPCVICPPNSNLTEISLAENEVRTFMSITDQITAWSKLFKSGYSAEDIANRFGSAATTVQKRLRLADIIPEVLDMHRNEEINLKTLQAFTLATSQDHQRQALQDINDFSLFSITQYFKADTLNLSAPIAKYVGKQAYIDAGGQITESLFNTPALDIN